jgi:hypothetical protein
MTIEKNEAAGGASRSNAGLGVAIKHWKMLVAAVIAAAFGMAFALLSGAFAAGIWAGGCYGLGYLFAHAFATKGPNAQGKPTAANEPNEG